MRAAVLQLTIALLCLMFVGCAPKPDAEGSALAPDDALSQAAKDRPEQEPSAGVPEKMGSPALEPAPVEQEKPGATEAPAPKAAPVTDVEEEPEPEGDADDGDEEPKDSPPVYEKAVAAFNEVKAGDEACEQGDIDTAIKHYEKALKLAPEAPKNRFGYAQLLYWKGLSYVQECQTAFQKSLGALSGDSLKEWLNGPAKLSDEEKRELQNRDNECWRRGESYFKKALEELTRCDADWGYAVEAVAFAKGIVNLVMERFGYANGEFKRVLESKRTSEETKREVKALIEKITQYQRELGKEEKEAEDEKKEGE